MDFVPAELSLRILYLSFADLHEPELRGFCASEDSSIGIIMSSSSLDASKLSTISSSDDVTGFIVS